MSDIPNIEQLLEKFIDEFVERAGAHCQSVRVFITLEPRGQSTRSFSSGKGNYFAQYGQIRHWIIQQEEAFRQDAPRMEDEP